MCVCVCVCVCVCSCFLILRSYLKTKCMDCEFKMLILFPKYYVHYLGFH